MKIVSQTDDTVSDLTNCTMNNNQLLVKETCMRNVRIKLFSTDFAVCWIKCCIVVRRSAGVV